LLTLLKHLNNEKQVLFYAALTNAHLCYRSVLQTFFAYPCWTYEEESLATSQRQDLYWRSWISQSHSISSEMKSICTSWMLKGNCL